MIKFKNVFMRIFASVLVVLILSFSVGSSYFDAYNVEAAEIGMAAAGGAAAWEYIAALLASIGLGAAAAENRDALVDTFLDAWSDRAHADVELAEMLVDGCMYVYDSAADTVRAIPWDDFINSLQDFHDTSVDNLTDLYVSFCPELLGSWTDLLQSIVNDDVYVEGLSEAVISLDGTFSDYESIQNLDGSYHLDAYYYWFVSNQYCWQHFVNDYVDQPVVYFTTSSSRSYSFAYYDVRNHALVGMNPTGKYGFSDVAPAGFSDDTFIANVPVFSSKDAALAAFESDDFSSALNYSDVLGLDHDIIDNNDLPFWDMETQALLDRVGAPDVVYGPWSLTGDYVDEQGATSDLPFIGLGDLDDYANSVSDVIDHVFDQWLAGERDLAPDIPDTYGDLYDAAISDAWDDVISDSYPGVRDPAQPDVVVPGERPGVLDPDRPVVDDPANSIDDVLTDAIDIADPVPGLVDDFSGFGLSLKDKFPFCIPWDIYYLLTKLSEAPKTPVFKLPLYLSRYGIHEDIVIDLSPFESVSKLSRAFLSLLFALGLIKLTISFVGMIDDNVTT